MLDMLAKSVEKNGKDWDKHLPFILYTYRSCIQQFTGESPFYLMYERDPHLPTDEALDVQVDRWLIDIEDYKGEMTQRFSEAWRLAQTEIEKAEEHQKKVHDQKARLPDMQVGTRVFVYKPVLKQKANKFARSLQAHME